jgi:two-component system, OmpR family, sensor histidine kinase KdpD
MTRGELRVYLGAAAGVGKTYAMLNEGHRRREYGEDVVVGFVEPHKRAKTAAQVADLEVIPRKQMAYRGATLDEMDVDAILERRPRVALVDELAHTNVPGSRNEKRWQDVEELLEAGISVISTLNIQHLESLNDVVEEITGVKQRETIPDEVVRRADELQLVDLTPGALRNRLARGDVYPPERIDTALANYFRPGNLSALRELALAWLADRVDEGLEEYRRRHGIEEPWETRERVLVALTGSPDGERLIRRAARIAQRTKGELVAVHVIPQDGLAAPAAELLQRQRELVALLGGSYHEVVGEDIGDALLDAARSLNVTQIVMGASRRSKWQRLTRGSVIGKVIRGSGTRIDVHVVSHPDAAEEAFTLPRTRRPATLPRRRVAIGLALAAGGPPALAVLLTQLREHIGLPSALLLFLLLVVGVSAVGGLLPALVAAVSAFLLVNWYFTPPLYTLTISEGENILALIVFLAVAGTVSVFVDLAARRAAEGRRARAEAEALSRLAGSSPVPALLESLIRVLGLDGASVLHRREGDWRIEAATGARAPETPQAASSTIDLDADHVLALAGGPIRSEDERVLEAFAKELTASVELGDL